jgi:hypothetical protein
MMICLSIYLCSSVYLSVSVCLLSYQVGMGERAVGSRAGWATSSPTEGASDW